MNAEYDGILGTVLNHGTQALIIGHVDCILTEREVGFEINNNLEPEIDILKPIEKSLEELLDGYKVSGRCITLNELRDKLDNLNWLGYAYVMKTYPKDKPGKPPLLVIGKPSIVDLNIWEEISTDSVIQQINDRANVVGAQQ